LRSLLRETIEQDVQYWLPYVKLKKVELESSEDMHTISIKLNFRIDTVGANVVINVLANENALQITSIEQGDVLEQVGTFGSDTAFNTGLGGSY